MHIIDNNSCFKGEEVSWKKFIAMIIYIIKNLFDSTVPKIVKPTHYEYCYWVDAQYQISYKVTRR